MEIARLNFSHGTHDYHLQTIENIKQVRELYQEAQPFTYKPIALALDTKGPEIRTGLIKGCGSASITLVKVTSFIYETLYYKLSIKGARFRLSLDSEAKENGNQHQVYVDYQNLVKVVKRHDMIFIDDGLISLKVDKIES